MCKTINFHMLHMRLKISKMANRRIQYFLHHERRNTFLAFVIVIILLIVFRELYFQWNRDKRCLHEVRHYYHPIEINPGTKEGKKVEKSQNILIGRLYGVCQIKCLQNKKKH